MNTINRTIRISRIAVTICVVLTVGVTAAYSQETRDPSDIERFGIGVIVGEPTGISAKGWFADTAALDAAAAWNFSRGWFHFHGDYLQHFYDVFDVGRDRLPLYMGVGGYLNFGDGTETDGNDVNAGVRVPVGVSLLSSELPIELFAEIVPSLKLVDETDFDLFGGVGIRYRF
ncbi:MAG: hypothetical protein ACOCZ9_04205 [Spirochaetota bacterium]